MLYHSVVLQTRGERKTIEEAYPCEDDLGERSRRAYGASDPFAVYTQTWRQMLFLSHSVDGHNPPILATSNLELST
ncbi:hypothetical protein WG66_004246 [Moniliophthora roreri]|nr:hypothetical protein WG66_004246 [Moniliophthora roreri]